MRALGGIITGELHPRVLLGDCRRPAPRPAFPASKRRTSFVARHGFDVRLLPARWVAAPKRRRRAGLRTPQLRDFGTDAIHSTSRKWTTAPGGVRMMAARAGLAIDVTLARVSDLRCEHRCASGPFVRARRAPGRRARSNSTRLAEVGAMTRTAVAGVARWRVVDTPAPSPRSSRRTASTLERAGQGDRRAPDRHHLRRRGSGAARDDRPGAAPLVTVSG